jgi:tetratricopeptide (TPR) repeat protein
MEAYRAYVSGMDALNRIALDSATVRFERAVRLDSNFALPHLQLRRLTNDTLAARAHLQAAIRLSASLPPNARALVDGLAAQMSGDQARLCQAANLVVGADSVDAEGWSLLAWCYRDLQVVVENGRPRLRGDINRALRAAERAYALAPGALSSVSAINVMVGIGSFMQCVPPATTVCPPDNNYRVAFLPAGDSLAVVVGAWRDVRHAPADLTPAAIEGQAARMRRLMGVVERLLATNPDSRILQNALAGTAHAAGDLSTADAHYGRGRPGPLDTVGGNMTQYLQGRLELSLALERPAAFQAYADSLFARLPNGLTQYRSMLGRLSEVDTSAAGRQNTAWRGVLIGVLPPGFDTLEQQIAARLTGPQHDDFLQLTTLAGFHLRHTGPALDTAARHPLKRYQAWFSRGDAARARAALTEFDRELLARHPNTPDDGGWLFDAEAYLDLGDTATAFQRMQEFGRRWGTSIQGAYVLEMRYFQSTTPRLWGRAWLLYGDLAMARNQSADARRAYKMVVGLWEHGEPPVQPMVARAKAALAQLGT